MLGLCTSRNGRDGTSGLRSVDVRWVAALRLWTMAVVVVVNNDDRGNRVMRSPATVIVTGGLVVPGPVRVDVPAAPCASGGHEQEGANQQGRC